MRDTINWDYLAGWFDADGCVHIHTSKRHYVSLTFANTDRQVIEVIQEFLGLTRLKISATDPTRYPRHKSVCYFLTVAKYSDVAHILKCLKNRCITKHDAITAALKWQEENPLKLVGRPRE